MTSLYSGWISAQRIALFAGASAGRVVRHQQAFGEGGGPVVVRGVDHLDAEEGGGHALVLEDGLEGPLGNLGLVGRVGGEELAPRGEGGHDGGDEVVVGSGAEEPGRGRGREILRGQRLDLAHRLHLGEGTEAGRAREARASGMSEKSSSTLARRCARAWPRDRRRSPRCRAWLFLARFLLVGERVEEALPLAAFEGAMRRSQPAP
jgi:hypothetical protein